MFRQHPWLLVGTLGSLFLARWLAIQSSRWAWSGIEAHSRELIFWVMPRGLISVVLAIAVARERGAGLEFVPGLAFAVILMTNALLILASFRARRAVPAAAPSADEAALGGPQSARCRGAVGIPPAVGTECGDARPAGRRRV